MDVANVLARLTNRLVGGMSETPLALIMMERLALPCRRAVSKVKQNVIDCHRPLSDAETVPRVRQYQQDFWVLRMKMASRGAKTVPELLLCPRL